jgi:hypothetical protein
MNLVLRIIDFTKDMIEKYPKESESRNRLDHCYMTVIGLTKVISDIKKYKIHSVICDDSYFRVSFYDTRDTLNITPEGNCCSHNWFEDFDNPSMLIGAHIHTIDENPFCVNREDNVDSELDSESGYNPDCCDETRIIYINDFTFKFRHKCNGYYSGWVNYMLKNDLKDN